MEIEFMQHPECFGLGFFLGKEILENVGFTMFFNIAFWTIVIRIE